MLQMFVWRHGDPVARWLVALLDKPRGEGISDCRTLTGVGLIGQPRWSPDGSLVAYVEFQERRLSIEEKAARTGGWEEELKGYLMVVKPRGSTSRRVGRFGGCPYEGEPFVWAMDSLSVLYGYSEMFEDFDDCAEQEDGREDGGEAAVPDRFVNIGIRALSVTSGQRAELAVLELTGDKIDMSSWTAPDVVPSPDGQVVAFADLRWAASKWHRNIAVLHFGSSELRLVTAFPDATRRTVAGFGDLAWSDDRVYFTCENPRARVPPNPRPDQSSMAAREIWSVREDGEDLRQETAGPDDGYPAPRPGGKDLAFLRDGSICLREANGSVRTLVEAKHGEAQPGHCVGPMSWSPDGEQIAFTWVGKTTGCRTIWAARVADR
jgi:hypothetical protein